MDTKHYPLIKRNDGFGYGTAGRRIRVWANCLILKHIPSVTSLQLYDVAIQPETLTTAMNRRIWRTLERHPKMGGIGHLAVYDGRSMAFSTAELPVDEPIEVTLSDERGTRPPLVFTVRFQLTVSSRAITPKLLKEFLDGNIDPIASAKVIRPYLHALDVLLWHRYQLSSNPVIGSSVYFQGSSRMTLEGGLEARRGYFLSVRPAENGLLLNIDATQTAFYQSGPAIDILRTVLNIRELPSSISLRPGDVRQLLSVLRGVRFEVQHGPYAQRPKRFKLRTITEAGANRVYFENKEKDSQTQDVADYFHEKYNIRLKYPSLQCFDTEKGSHFPIELCTIVTDQRFMHRLNPLQVNNMLAFATSNPDARKRSIEEGIQQFNFRNNESLRDFAVQVDEKLIDVDARQLEAPELRYAAPLRPRDGVWNLRGVRFNNSPQLQAWAILTFESQRHVAETLCMALLSEARNIGMNITNDRPPIVVANPNGQIQGAIKDAADRAFYCHSEQDRMRNRPPQLLVVILPRGPMADKVYAEVKRVADTISDIVTQCVKVEKCTGRISPQYAANVLLKVNAKIGGVNAFPGRQLAQTPTLFIGADVTHPPPSASRRDDAYSIAAIVGSIDRNGVQYRARTAAQAARSEIINIMGSAVKDLLKYFYHHNNRVEPESIIIYRDGVSEGQFAQVAEREIAAVVEACQEIRPNYSPKISFIIVNKRHHLRFFPMSDADKDRSGNLRAGTVVDRQVVHPNMCEFYLFGHAGLKGTSRPTRYDLIFDQNGMGADALQELTFKLCHLSARCTRSVSVVPPVYYAHLAAKRARLQHGDTGSDTASVMSGNDGPMVNPDARVKGCVMDSMYFV